MAGLRAARSVAAQAQRAHWLEQARECAIAREGLTGGVRVLLLLLHVALRLPCQESVLLCGLRRAARVARQPKHRHRSSVARAAGHSVARTGGASRLGLQVSRDWPDTPCRARACGHAACTSSPTSSTCAPRSCRAGSERRRATCEHATCQVAAPRATRARSLANTRGRKPARPPLGAGGPGSSRGTRPPSHAPPPARTQARAHASSACCVRGNATPPRRSPQLLDAAGLRRHAAHLPRRHREPGVRTLHQGLGVQESRPRRRRHTR